MEVMRRGGEGRGRGGEGRGGEGRGGEGRGGEGRGGEGREGRGGEGRGGEGRGGEGRGVERREKGIFMLNYSYVWARGEGVTMPTEGTLGAACLPGDFEGADSPCLLVALSHVCLSVSHTLLCPI